MQADFDARSTTSDMQLQSLVAMSALQSAHEQALALRQLEDKARTWAKKAVSGAAGAAMASG